MKNNSSAKQITKDKFIFWAACVILFLPVLLLPPAFQPSDWTRSILFKIILTILISFLFFKFFYKKEISVSFPKLNSPVYWPVLALLSFCLLLAVSTILSQDARFSIFGSPARSGGLLNYLFLAVFAIFCGLFVSGESWKKLIKASFIVGFLAGILAIMQYFGFLNNVFIDYEAGGPPSFLGNSTFLAIYMIFLAFSSFAYFLQEKEKKAKLLYAGLFILFIFTILISGSRATYLGMLIGAIFYFFFLPPDPGRAGLSTGSGKIDQFISKKLKYLKLSVICLLLLAIGIVIVFNLLPQTFAKDSLMGMIADRLSIKTVAEDLAGTRLSAWKITWEAIKEKPLFGWGPENFYIGFEKYFDPTLPPSLQKLWWDRPHNVFLEIWANSGLFSLFLYASFWAVLIYQLWQLKAKHSDSKNAYLAHSIQSMFLAYLVALFFNFDSFSTYLISFFFIGYSFYLLSEYAEKTEILPPQKSILQKKPALAVLAVFLMLFFWFWNIKPLYLNEKIVFAKNMAQSKQCKKAFEIANSENWEKSGIVKSYTILKYSSIIKDCTYSQPDKEVEYSKKIIGLLKSASEIQPGFSRTWLFLGGFTNVLAAREENADNKKSLLAEARSYLDRSLQLSPKRQEVLIELEKNHLVAEDYQSMKKTAEDCYKIDPSRGECYWYLGIAEIFLGDQENGKKHIKESKDKGYLAPPYIQLAAAYISQKDYKDAIDIYTSYIYDIKNPSYHATLAFLYRQVRDYAKAGEEAVEVFKLQPDNKEAEEFLKSLLKLDSNSAELHTSIAYIYEQAGEAEKARQEYLILKSIYLQYTAMYPKNAGYHLKLAAVYGKLGEYEKAYQEALIVIKLDPDADEVVSQFIQTLPDSYKIRYSERHLNQ